MCRVDHLRVYGSSVPSEFPKQVFPDATPRPAYEAVIDRRRWTISFRTIAPAAAALEHVHDPADHAPVIRALDTTHILRQMRLNPCPLFVAQPEQIPAHQFFPNTNQYRIVQTEKLMSSDPRSCVSQCAISFHADKRILAQPGRGHACAQEGCGLRSVIVRSSLLAIIGRLTFCVALCLRVYRNQAHPVCQRIGTKVIVAAGFVFSNFVVGVIVVAALYFTREILIARMRV
jgi:hypothetical protein